jgi:isopentenyl-diphosphate Delta-isomerase
VTTTSETELVVLLGEDGDPVGTALKSEVHGPDTPLHLAFSCHVLDEHGEVLVTRRALTKATWPGVWTNSFCGHPQPDEPMIDAVNRRARFELGIRLSHIELVLPSFRYRARDASGIVENEVCPVYLARTSSRPSPRPAEVMDHVWVRPEDLGTSIRLTPWAYSPWLVLQAPSLPFLGHA